RAGAPGAGHRLPARPRDRRRPARGPPGAGARRVPARDLGPVPVFSDAQPAPAQAAGPDRRGVAAGRRRLARRRVRRLTDQLPVAATASRITLATSAGRDCCGTWLVASSVVLAPIFAAIARCRPGSIMRSRALTTNQDGLPFQAGVVTLSLKALAWIGPWVAV